MTLQEVIDSQTCNDPHGFYNFKTPHLHGDLEDEFCEKCGGLLGSDGDFYFCDALRGAPIGFGGLPIVRPSHASHTIDECQLNVLQDIRRLLVERP